MKQSKVIPVAVVRKHYEDFQERISGYESRTERKALTGYLLYSMLVASGRHGEIFTDGTVTDDPQYIFFDTARSIRGRAEILRYHESLSENGMRASFPSNQRIAVASWGFASEETTNSYLRGNLLERFRTAMVWRCDGDGRMQSMRMYPAAERTMTAVASDDMIAQKDIASTLEPLVASTRAQLKLNGA